MDYGTITTVFDSFYVEANQPYYKYRVTTTWRKEAAGWKNPLGYPERRCRWTTEVIRLNRDGTESAVADQEYGDSVPIGAFDFAHYAPLTGDAVGSSGHRQALEAHKQVVFLVMG